MQITSQVGPVLRIAFPDVFSDIVEMLKSVNFWDKLFDAECEGLDGFASKWFVTIAVLPGILTGLTLGYYSIERWLLASSREDEKNAATRLQSNMFTAVFFVFPPICNVVFATFNCRPMAATSDADVLMTDDRVRCKSSEHQQLIVPSYIVMVAFCFGLPLFLAYNLVKQSWEYATMFASGSESLERAVADRVAEDFHVDVEAAQYIIRDVSMSASFSFITDAYHPKVLYWETLDMLRKVLLGKNTLPFL
jgi:hypothetical protein